MTKTPDALPQSGGSFVRQKNGELKQVEKPTEPQPLGKTPPSDQSTSTEPKEA